MSWSSYPGSITGGQNSLLMLPRGFKANTNRKAIVVIHGRSGTSLDGLPGGGFGDHTRALTDYGYAVLSIDAGGTTTWGNSTSVTAVTNAVGYLNTTVGASNTKVGFLAWSMGGTVALNWIKRNTSQTGCVWLWAPCTDLDWAHSQGTYTSEVNTAYSGNYTTNSVGYKVADEPASWRNVAPIRIAHAADDTTVPQSQSSNFVTSVNDSKVTFRPVSSGGHTGLFANVPTSEVIAFFDANL